MRIRDIGAISPCKVVQSHPVSLALGLRKESQLPQMIFGTLSVVQKIKTKVITACVG